MIKIGVTAVIFDQQGRVLLTQRQDLRNWVFPGGGVEEGESLNEAVFREVYEETGVKIKSERLVAVIIREILFRRGVVFLFSAKKGGGREKRQRGEALSLKWISIPEAYSWLDKEHRERLKLVLASKDSIIIRRNHSLPFPWYKLPLYFWRRGLGKKLGLVKV